MNKIVSALILAAFAAVAFNVQAASHAGAPMKASEPAAKASAPAKKEKAAAPKKEAKPAASAAAK